MKIHQIGPLHRSVGGLDLSSYFKASITCIDELLTPAHHQNVLHSVCGEFQDRDAGIGCIAVAFIDKLQIA